MMSSSSLHLSRICCLFSGGKSSTILQANVEFAKFFAVISKHSLVIPCPMYFPIWYPCCLSKKSQPIIQKKTLFFFFCYFEEGKKKKIQCPRIFFFWEWQKILLEVKSQCANRALIKREKNTENNEIEKKIDKKKKKYWNLKILVKTKSFVVVDQFIFCFLWKICGKVSHSKYWKGTQFAIFGYRIFELSFDFVSIYLN